MRGKTLFLFSLALFAVFLSQSVSGAEPDRYWFLIHDRAVLAQLKLTAAEQTAMRRELDELDGKFMALRGTTPEKMAAELPGIIVEAKKRLHEVLRPEQEQRLNEVVLRVQGPAALLRDEIATRMKFTPEQKKKLQGIIGDTQQSIADLEKQAREGKPVEPLEKEAQRLRKDEQSKVVKLLTRPQQTLWQKLVGPPLIAGRLGQMAFKAPELVDAKIWINSQPLTLAQLKGKVVALHFYTFG